MNHAFDVEKILTIAAPVSRVWDALTNPDLIRRYMFGSAVECDWKVGSPIFFRGEWQGRPYEDRGVIQAFEPDRKLEYTYYSPLSGLPDTPENYHLITVEISDEGDTTRLRLVQANNRDDQTREHSSQGWDAMLGGLKNLLE